MCRIGTAAAGRPSVRPSSRARVGTSRDDVCVASGTRRPSSRAWVETPSDDAVSLWKVGVLHMTRHFMSLNHITLY